MRTLEGGAGLPLSPGRRDGGSVGQRPFEMGTALLPGGHFRILTTMDGLQTHRGTGTGPRAAGRPARQLAGCSGGPPHSNRHSDVRPSYAPGPPPRQRGAGWDGSAPGKGARTHAWGFSAVGASRLLPAQTCLSRRHVGTPAGTGAAALRAGADCPVRARRAGPARMGA